MKPGRPGSAAGINETNWRPGSLIGCNARKWVHMNLLRSTGLGIDPLNISGVFASGNVIPAQHSWTVFFSNTQENAHSSTHGFGSKFLLSVWESSRNTLLDMLRIFRVFGFCQYVYWEEILSLKLLLEHASRPTPKEGNPPPPRFYYVPPWQWHRSEWTIESKA